MTRGRETEVVVTAVSGGSEKGEKQADTAEPPRAPEDDRFAADLLLHALTQRLLTVEEWCGSHSEYFLG
jgi:hypothetical protein